MELVEAVSPEGRGSRVSSQPLCSGALGVVYPASASASISPVLTTGSTPPGKHLEGIHYMDFRPVYDCMPGKNCLQVPH